MTPIQQHALALRQRLSVAPRSLLTMCSSTTLVLTSTALLTACQEQSPQATSTEEQQTHTNVSTASTQAELHSPQPKTIVAEINGFPIDQNELDQKIRFQLHDLEWQAYQLRLNALQHLVKQEYAGDQQTPPQVTHQLTPPIPPLTQLPKSAVATNGENNAPITISVFCSFQSPHCKRMQPVYQQLEKQHPGQLKFEHFDYPLSFHRYARPAANAARCANQQGKFWEFSAALYSYQDDLNDARYRSIAQQLNINTPEFQHCISTLQHREAIEQDIALGESLNLSNVPITFINGLYVKGPVSLATLNFYTDYALAHLTEDKVLSTQTIAKTTLPLRLVAVNLASNAAQSSVVIEHIATKEQLLFQTNQAITFAQQTFEAPLISAIEAQRILLSYRGRQEYLALTNIHAKPSNDAQLTASSGSPSTSISANDLEGNAKNNTEDPWSLHPNRRFNEGNRELPVSTITPLSRDWLEQQLINQSELEKHFEPAGHQVEGHALLKLHEISQQEFYQTLGLKEGDVVLRVNDQWVHDGQNSLWDTLSQQAEVSIQLMRKGLPVRYDFSIQ